MSNSVPVYICSIHIYLSVCDIYIKKVKLATVIEDDCSRWRLEGSLFNSYYTEV